MRRLSSVCALLVGAALWTAPARGDEAVSVTLNVGHALPGTSVHVTVAPGCDATAVSVTLEGRSADDQAGTTGSAVDAQGTPSGSWEADLPVADDLAAPQDVSVTAAATCASGTVAGSAPLKVAPFLSQRLSVSPAQAVAGEEVEYVMRGGHGSCASAWVTDAAGAQWWLFGPGGSAGKELTGAVDPASDMSSHVAGVFEVPDGMALGAASMTVHCSQTVDAPARLEVVPLSGGTPSGTPAPRRTGSRITLGGGLPVVTAVPTDEVDPRYPLPTLAPPLEATAAPVVAAAVQAASGGPWVGWWALLGLLVLPVLAVPWGLRRRRRALSRS